MMAAALMALGMNAEFIVLQGTQFRCDLNARDMTATIVDYKIQIDDAKYPMKNQKRKLRSVQHTKGSTPTLTIPEKVSINGKEYTITSIGRAAFAYYTNFEYVDIPSTVTSIGEFAFFNTNLVEVKVPSSVTSIGDRAFGRCYKLGYLTLPQGVNMGDRVYAESEKKVILTTGEPVMEVPTPYSPMASVQQQKRPATPVRVVSDVDRDLPATSRKAENTFAVIIANELYKNDPQVTFALQDGRSFRDYCETVLGLPNSHIRLQENATLNEMRTVVNWMQEVARVYKGQARFLLYYAGHGTQGKDEITSLLPTDGSSLVESTGYPLRDLYTQLGDLNAEYVCVFLDACFSGMQRNNELMADVRGARRVVLPKSKGKMVVFSAAQDKETAFAYPEKGHGVFTYFLLKKLKESKGDVTLGELSDYIQDRVSKTALVDLQSQQTPSVSSSATIATTWQKLSLREK